jgi:hypothetical protein
MQGLIKPFLLCFLLNFYGLPQFLLLICRHIATRFWNITPDRHYDEAQRTSAHAKPEGILVTLADMMFWK